MLSRLGLRRYAVDHIFHTECGVSAAAVLKLSTEDEVGEKGLPSVNWPSDHLSLYTEFALSAEVWSSNDDAQPGRRTTGQELSLATTLVCKCIFCQLTPSLLPCDRARGEEAAHRLRDSFVFFLIYLALQIAAQTF